MANIPAHSYFLAPPRYRSGTVRSIHPYNLGGRFLGASYQVVATKPVPLQGQLWPIIRR